MTGAPATIGALFLWAVLRRGHSFVEKPVPLRHAHVPWGKEASGQGPAGAWY